MIYFLKFFPVQHQISYFINTQRYFILEALYSKWIQKNLTIHVNCIFPVYDYNIALLNTILSCQKPHSYQFPCSYVLYYFITFYLLQKIYYNLLLPILKKGILHHIFHCDVELKTLICTPNTGSIIFIILNIIYAITTAFKCVYN